MHGLCSKKEFIKSVWNLGPISYRNNGKEWRLVPSQGTEAHLLHGSETEHSLEMQL